MKRLFVLLGLLFVAAACGDDGTGGVFDTATTSGDAATSTTAAAPTTAAPTSTADPAAPSTTAAPTTTLAIAAPTTTTSSTLGLATPPSTFQFRPDGLGVADFGDSPDSVITTLTEIFGPPTFDTGWIAEPLCPGPMDRIVDFGAAKFDFRVFFSDGDLFAPAGTQHFHSYRYKGATPVPVSPPDLTVGATVANLTAEYPAAYFQPNPFLPDQTDFHVDAPGEARLYGYVSGTDPGDLVEYIQGGAGCGE